MSDGRIDALMAVDEKDYYGILSTACGDKLDASSSSQQLRTAFHKAAKLLHPDRLPHDGKLGNDGWNRVRTAFVVLSDDVRRACYDAGDHVGLEDVCVSTEDEVDTLSIPMTGGKELIFFKNNADLVDSENKLTLFKPLIIDMPRKLKGNRFGDTSYVSKNAATGTAINVIFHDGEWKWLRSRRNYSPEELVMALQTEQRLSLIGITAFGLRAGHTQDWLKTLEQEGCGQTPEGRAKLVSAAHAQLKTLTYADGSGAHASNYDSPAHDSTDEDNEQSHKRPRLLVPREQAILQHALRQCEGARDEADTLEAKGGGNLLREIGLA